MDNTSDLVSYIDTRLSELERFINSSIEAVADKQNQAWETHRHQHYAAERAHAELHEVHNEAHRREHGFTEAALKKSDTEIAARLVEFNEFKDQLMSQAANHITNNNLDNKLINYVTMKEFSTVRSLVYGAVAMVLTSFMGALVALVIVTTT